jgi:hypothetical protein
MLIKLIKMKDNHPTRPSNFEGMEVQNHVFKIEVQNLEFEFGILILSFTHLIQQEAITSNSIHLSKYTIVS